MACIEQRPQGGHASPNNGLCLVHFLPTAAGFVASCAFALLPLLFRYLALCDTGGMGAVCCSLLPGPRAYDPIWLLFHNCF